MRFGPLNDRNFLNEESQQGQYTEFPRKVALIRALTAAVSLMFLASCLSVFATTGQVTEAKSVILPAWIVPPG